MKSASPRAAMAPSPTISAAVIAARKKLEDLGVTIDGDSLKKLSQADRNKVRASAMREMTPEVKDEYDSL